jgi:hypothetical protein
MRSSAMVIARFVFMAVTEFPASSHVGLHLLVTDPGQVNGVDCGYLSSRQSSQSQSLAKGRVCLLLARNVETNYDGVPTGGCG